MNILVISGSTRGGSESRRISDYLSAQLDSKDAKSDVLDLHELNLPIFGQTGDDGADERIESAKKQLESADGFVLVIPEWNGAAAPGIFNLFLQVGVSMAHKPAMIVGVSAGRGGQYPIRDLHGVGYKNTKYVISPENIVVTDAANMFKDDQDPEDFIVKRTDYALDVLIEYAKALKPVRNLDLIDHETYPFGM